MMKPDSAETAGADSGPQQDRDRHRAELHDEVNRLNCRHEHALAHKRRSLDEISRKIDGLLDAIADGPRTPGLKARLEQLEARKLSLEAGIAARPAPARQLHRNLAELYRRKVARLHEALAEPETRAQAIESLRELIDRVTMTPVEPGF